MTAYYNENDPYAAQWLRNLIAGGHIAPGVVDDRSILDIRPDELGGFSQHHFFAGIGVWSYALRAAGWSDDRPVWTGSCPCQPFSGAGKREGIEDARHLWPVWFRLIRECRPGVILGEQVASGDGLGWWDIVSNDLESEAYAAGAVDTCVPGVGGPHIRQRLYWLANAASARHVGPVENAEGKARDETRVLVSGAERGLSGLANADDKRSQGRVECRNGPNECIVRSASLASGMVDPASERHRTHDMEPLAGRWECAIGSANGARAGRLADADGGHTGTEWQQRSREHRQQPEDCRAGEGRTGPLNGFWANADWLFCTDGRWRPVESGSQPLASGVAGRVGKLRAYGNAINAEQAVQFIEAVMCVI